MARGYAKSNTEAIASDMRASGVTIQQPRQQTVVEYFKDKPNRSLKGLYKAGTNIQWLNGRTGNFEVARVLEVNDRNIILFPIFKTEGLDMASIGSIKFTIERGPDGKPVGLHSKKYNLRAGL
jgi:hypothetical protein